MSLKQGSYAKPSVRSTVLDFAPKPPQPPAVPSPWELAETPKPQPKGLFEELLGRDHLVLYQDVGERPDLYDAATVRLIEELSGGTRKYDQLDARERQLLDGATLEFVTKGPAAVQQKRDKIVKQVAKKMRPPVDNPTTAPESSMPPFWWLDQPDGPDT